MKLNNKPFGITTVTSIAVRAFPNHKSELQSQLLFGESFKVLKNEEKWILICILPYNLEGWIPNHSFLPVDAPGLQAGDQDCYVNLQMVSVSRLDHVKHNLTILPGSSLPCRPEIGRVFTLGNLGFRFESPIPEEANIKDKNSIEALALIFIHAPYLWGGRGLFGIDNVNLIQLVYKMRGIILPGNLDELVNLGSPVSFAHEALPGDLAFFENKEGEIIHAGIVTQLGKIVHSFGSVREDPLDHAGIYGANEEEYLFFLRMINRII